MTIRVSSLQSVPTPALMERMSLDARSHGIGVQGLGDLKVSQGAGMQSAIAAGRARIRANQAGAGTNSGVQDVLLEVAESVTHSTADPTNPRMDLVYVRVQDAALSGSVNKANVGIVTGTPTAGATFNNRNGVGSLPLGSMLLADVFVAAGSTGTFPYRDRRQFGSFGVIPPIRQGLDQVAFYFLGQSQSWCSFSASSAGFQSSALAYLPRSITATTMRWLYMQELTTALTGNYNLGIYDASGRKMVESGVTPYQGGVGTLQIRGDTIPETLFEAGMYYIVFGESGTAGGTSTGVLGIRVGATAGIGGPNTTGFAPSGGTTLQTVLNHQEIIGTNPHPNQQPIPGVVLSNI